MTSGSMLMGHISKSRLSEWNESHEIVGTSGSLEDQYAFPVWIHLSRLEKSCVANPCFVPVSRNEANSLNSVLSIVALCGGEASHCANAALGSMNEGEFVTERIGSPFGSVPMTLNASAIATLFSPIWIM